MMVSVRPVHRGECKQTCFGTFIPFIAMRLAWLGQIVRASSHLQLQESWEESYG